MTASAQRAQRDFGERSGDCMVGASAGQGTSGEGLSRPKSRSLTRAYPKLLAFGGEPKSCGLVAVHCGDNLARECVTGNELLDQVAVAFEDCFAAGFQTVDVINPDLTQLQIVHRCFRLLFYRG